MACMVWQTDAPLMHTDAPTHNASPAWLYALCCAVDVHCPAGGACPCLHHSAAAPCQRAAPCLLCHQPNTPSCFVMPGFCVCTHELALLLLLLLGWLHNCQVKPLTRFLCDASLSGGSWVWVCSTPTHRSSPQQQQQQQNMAAAAPGSSISSSRPLMCEFVPAGSGRRRSSCAVELVCSWQCLHSLTPDATQLAELDWQPQVSLWLWRTCLPCCRALKVLQ